MAEELQFLEMNNGGARRRFYFRAGTSDPEVVEQIFVRAHYDLTKLSRWSELSAFLDRKSRSGAQPLIVDAGANIGASAVYFALAFPMAKVVAIEPEPGNFDLLVKNVEGLDAICMQAGLAAAPGYLEVTDPGGGHWRYRTEPAGEGGVPCVTIDDLYDEFLGEATFPFLVKLDIEGGEKDVFAANTGWVARTPLVVAELHDQLYPKSGSARPFLHCVSALDRDFVYFGENVFSIANALG